MTRILGQISDPESSTEEMKGENDPNHFWDRDCSRPSQKLVMKRYDTLELG